MTREVKPRTQPQLLVLSPWHSCLNAFFSSPRFIWIFNPQNQYGLTSNFVSRIMKTKSILLCSLSDSWYFAFKKNSKWTQRESTLRSPLILSEIQYQHIWLCFLSSSGIRCSENSANRKWHKTRVEARLGQEAKQHRAVSSRASIPNSWAAPRRASLFKSPLVQEKDFNFLK